MIFKPDHVTLIQAGQKTQTRRLGKCRWVVGHVYRITLGWYDKIPQCYIRVLDVHQDRLGNITEAEARREGYHSVESYRSAWERIYKAKWDPELLVWVVTFCLHDGKPERTKQTNLLDQLEEV